MYISVVILMYDSLKKPCYRNQVILYNKVPSNLKIVVYQARKTSNPVVTITWEEIRVALNEKD